jgi:hypothetical protein
MLEPQWYQPLFQQLRFRKIQVFRRDGGPPFFRLTKVTPKAAVQPWAWERETFMGTKASTPAFFAIRRQPAQSFFEIGIAAPF